MNIAKADIKTLISKLINVLIPLLPETKTIESINITSNITIYLSLLTSVTPIATSSDFSSTNNSLRL